jgi:hypothetical protein
MVGLPCRHAATRAYNLSYRGANFCADRVAHWRSIADNSGGPNMSGLPARLLGRQLVAVVGDSHHDDVRGGELVAELVELIEQPGQGQAGVLGEVRDLDASSGRGLDRLGIAVDEAGAAGAVLRAVVRDGVPRRMLIPAEARDARQGASGGGSSWDLPGGVRRTTACPRRAPRARPPEVVDRSRPRRTGGAAA